MAIFCPFLPFVHPCHILGMHPLGIFYSLLVELATSDQFHLNFDVNGDNKCSNARRAFAVIVNYFKHVQLGRRRLVSFS